MKKTAQGDNVRVDGLMPIAPEKNFTRIHKTNKSDL